MSGIKHRYYLEVLIWNIQGSYMKEDPSWTANADIMTNELETELQFIRNNVDWESSWVTEFENTEEEIYMFYPVYDSSTDINSNDDPNIVVGENVYVNCSKEEAEQYPDLIEYLEEQFKKVNYLKKEKK